MLVAGYDFGYATGRESPSRALRVAGIRAIVGGPFARMLYRNAINNGILVVECPEIAAAGVAGGAEVEVDLDAGEIRCAGSTYAFRPVPRVVRDIAAARPRAVAYVACDPAAFARDVRTFTELPPSVPGPLPCLASWQTS